MSSELFDAIAVLIPGYSIEDLPTDLNEQHAAGLLNAIAAAWHPQLLAASKGIVSFRQAEITDMPPGRQVILVPECSEDWLGHDWRESLADTTSVVISGSADRDSWFDEMRQGLAQATGDGEASPGSDDLVDDFMALGIYHLEVMLLSRRMHHFMDPDEYLLDAEVHSACEAWLADDLDEARDHLRRCFECLQETREQFHPVDSFFIDLCLPKDGDTEELTTAIQNSENLSLCCSAGELAELCDANDQLRETVVSKVADGHLCLLTGHLDELRTSLGSASLLYDDIAGGLTRLQKLLGNFPRHWARRRFGMTHSIPEMLKVFGFESAMHVALDDGIYPDREYGQMTWQGPGRGEVAGTSRIPLAIDSASTFLRFPDRFTETMQEDNTAVMLLAHLPTLNTPWLQDLRIGAGYAPVLGQFVTFDEFITQTSGQGSSFRFNAGEYLSPALIQSSVLKSEPPISSPAELHTLRASLDCAAFVAAVVRMLKSDTRSADDHVEELAGKLAQEEVRRSDTSSTATAKEATAFADNTQEQFDKCWSQLLDSFCRLVPNEQSPQTSGLFMANPLPFSRHHVIEWPKELRPPDLPDKSDAAYQQDDQLLIETLVPAGGFLWLTESSSPSIRPIKVGKGQPLAQPFLLRNQHFEVLINEISGGIAEVRCHEKRGNRFSQQVAFRYENGKTIKDEDGEEFTCNYAFTRMVSSEILSTGPWLGSIRTTNEIVDAVSGEVMAVFHQTTSVERSLPRINIEIEFDADVGDFRGNPWMTYFCCRFAWDNEAASITRSLLGQASGFRSERFEAPDYIEVADSDQRLLIVPHGRPYHRRSGRRMMDSLLIVEGEDCRSFRFTIETDQPFPMRTVQELQYPVASYRTSDLRPKGVPSGWILGTTAKNVMLARLRSESASQQNCVELQPASSSDSANDGDMRLVLLLVETEGRSSDCLIRTARTPSAAYTRTACGVQSHHLEVDKDGVRVAMAGYQMQEVVLEFGSPPTLTAQTEVAAESASAGSSDSGAG